MLNHVRSWRGRTLRMVAFAAGIGGVLGWPCRDALACKAPPQPAHELDAQAQATDTVAPAAPAVSLGEIRRGKGPDTDYSSCSQSATSCDDMGSIALKVSAEDDRSPAESMGYSIELTAGQAPSGLSLPTKTVRAFAGAIYLAWADGATDDQESINFSLAIRAVDLAGNVGPATAIRVQHSGSDGGCTVVSRRPLSAWPSVPLLAVLVARLWRVWGRKRRSAPAQ